MSLRAKVRSRRGVSVDSGGAGHLNRGWRKVRGMGTAVSAGAACVGATGLEVVLELGGAAARGPLLQQPRLGFLRRGPAQLLEGHLGRALTVFAHVLGRPRLPLLGVRLVAEEAGGPKTAALPDVG
eukprot:CAMPEP_0179186334 /NCGR_PEP_ID=MMETSP0796-20121207/92417_1 /TAXON_ID=73915 /ORGANISM="Pyrodinium bahamense, Strain pbaha01" /LENGTH=125 /DNA_ID=CAMNT_0020890323 /DNA_START=200 /DNA_END=574 /DNA_ORIENTATION=-